MSITSLSLNSFQRPDPAEMRQKMFKEADTDGSGSISKDELKTMMANAPKPPDGVQKTESADDLFAKIDTNGDGEISEAENDTFLTARDAERAAQMGAASFNGSTDLVKSLLDALKQSDDEESSSSSSTSVQSSDTQDAKDKLIAALLDQLRQQNNQYTATGSTASSSSANLFSIQV